MEMAKSIWEVEIVGWAEKFYFSELGVAKQFGEKYVASGYKEYKVKHCLVREEI
jgi:hypothetical protein